MAQYLNREKIFFAIKKSFNYAYMLGFIINVILLFWISYSSGATPGANLLILSVIIFIFSVLFIMAILFPFFYFRYEKYNIER